MDRYDTNDCSLNVRVRKKFSLVSGYILKQDLVHPPDSDSVESWVPSDEGPYLDLALVSDFDFYICYIGI